MLDWLVTMAFQQQPPFASYAAKGVKISASQPANFPVQYFGPGSIGQTYPILPSGSPPAAGLHVPAAGFEIPGDALTATAGSGQASSVSTLAPDSDVASSMSGMTNVGPRPLPSVFPMPRSMPMGMSSVGMGVVQGQGMGHMMPIPFVMTPQGPMPWPMAAMAYGYYPMQPYMSMAGPASFMAGQGGSGAAGHIGEAELGEDADTGCYAGADGTDEIQSSGSGGLDAGRAGSKRARVRAGEEDVDGVEDGQEDWTVILPAVLGKALGRRAGRIPATEVYLQGQLLHSSAYSVGLYGVDGARQERLRMWMGAREKRVFHKKLKYERRHELANGRVRVKGRFVKDDGAGK